MTILLTGGGSGGHITPILAVADELKRQNPKLRLVYVGQRGDRFADIPKNHEGIDAVYLVSAGKFRRYHGQKWHHALNLKTMVLNLRDFCRFLAGTWQSYKLLGRLRPSAIYTPGGFVGVPVGIAAAIRKVPFITHDLDAYPGLANRINARWAVAHAVALPVENYSYPMERTHYVGVPVSDNYRKVSLAAKIEYRQGLDIPSDARVVTVTGGGLGADRLNRAVINLAPQLLEHYPNLFIFHIAGANHDQTISDLYGQKLTGDDLKRVIVRGFVSDLYRYSAAADVIITRAGATTLAEYARQQRACIVVPNPLLTGGHQLKNADFLESKGAVVVVDETGLKTNPDKLLVAVKELLNSSDKRRQLAETLGSLSSPKAASKLATLILSSVKKR